MGSSSEDAGSVVSASAKPAELEKLYRAVVGILLGVLHDRYRMPHAEATNLIAKMFRMYLATSAPGVDPASWLQAAVLTEAAAYHRRQAALAALPENAREALRLHHLEGWTYAEVAAALDVTPLFAKKLVWKARKELRARGVR